MPIRTRRSPLRFAWPLFQLLCAVFAAYYAMTRGIAGEWWSMAGSILVAMFFLLIALPIALDESR